MNNAASAAAVPSDQQIAEAINWLVKFESGSLSRAEQAAFIRWQNQSPQHALAWQRLGRASQHFGLHLGNQHALNSEQVLHSLDTADQRLRQKRRTLKTLLTISGVGLGLWFTRHHTGTAQLGQQLYGNVIADISTAVGEQRTLNLTDGARLLLNTQTALDVDMNAHPELVLHYGEVSIQSGRQMQLRTGHYLFSADTQSEWTLMHEDHKCRLQVLNGSVNCFVAGQQHTEVQAGQGLILSPGHNAHLFDIDRNSLGWRQGVLIAERMPLGHFMTQLARYHRGYLGCADEIASLTLSGSFPLADTTAILENLTQILPVRQQRIGPYWTRLLPV